MSVAEIRTRLGSNLQRVEGLAALSEWIEFPARSDLLRASVVLLHATLEDVLRSALELRLPQADAEHLTMLKFAVGKQAKEHITISELSRHRGKTVDQLISERIDAYLERSNFNNIADLEHALRRIGVETSLLDPHKAHLLGMMQRRHWIVHRADRDPSPGSLEHAQTRQISVKTVMDWESAVRVFCTELLAKLEES
jgi:hypothetical protein